MCSARVTSTRDDQKNAKEVLATAGARRVGSLSRDERAGECRGLRVVVRQQTLEALQRALAPGEPDAVDGEVVDEPRIEMMLGIAPAPARHADQAHLMLLLHGAIARPSRLR